MKIRRISRRPFAPRSDNDGSPRKRVEIVRTVVALALAVALIGTGAVALPSLAPFEASMDFPPAKGPQLEPEELASIESIHESAGMLAGSLKETVSDMTKALPAQRRGILIGQAGDRDDEAIREFARTAWAIAPERVFIKEMESFLRGREPGVVPALLESELRSLGAASEALSRHATELDAARAALQWAREGDLLLLMTHAQRDEVVGLIERLKDSQWTAGQWLGGA